MPDILAVLVVVGVCPGPTGLPLAERSSNARLQWEEISNMQQASHPR